MATPDFDYESFAQNLAQQAQEIVPPEFEQYQKEYVINTLGNFAMLSGKTLAEDSNLNFNADQAVMITQIIAEWSFHKSVDLIRSGIPQQFWDGVMQKIAYTIFEIAKQAFLQNMPNEQMLEIVEHHVKKTYTEAINELKDNGVIDEGLMEYALSQSNMDMVAQQMQEQASSVPQQVQEQSGSNLQPMDQYVPQKVDSKTLKLATVAMLFNKMKQDRVQSILNKFESEDAKTVIKYMKVPDLIDKVGAENAYKCLQEIKTALPKITITSPNAVVQIIQKFASQYSQNQLETLLIKERVGVKKLVFNALEGNYYDKIPPRIATIVAQHLSNSV